MVKTPVLVALLPIIKYTIKPIADITNIDIKGTKPKRKSKTIPLVLESIQNMARDVPEYISLNTKELKVSYIRYPSSDEIPYATVMSPASVVEFYSR